MDCPVVKLEIFIPKTHLELLRAALERVDAGHLGRYDHCFSYSEITGCWRPLPGASPYDGAVGVLCSAPEYKVEVCCLSAKLPETLAAIKAVHPYEEPVIHVLPMLATGL
ncbi:MAG: cytochrome C biogenesis protein [Pygmaiobacter sp.]